MTETAQRRLIIRTPEGIEFALALAGPMTRFLAWASLVRAHPSAVSRPAYLLAGARSDEVGGVTEPLCPCGETDVGHLEAALGPLGRGGTHIRLVVAGMDDDEED